MNQTITSLIVQIKVESAAALAALKDFAAGTDGAMQVVEGSAGKAGAGVEGINKNVFKARMGLMELEHTARSTMDILLMGGSPRMLLAQVPQMIQGATMLGLGMSTLLPIIGGVGAALGAGYWLWSEWTAGERAAAEEAKNLETAWKGLIPLLKEINAQQKVGLLGATAAGEYEAYLTRDKKLYRNSEGQLTPNSTENVERPIFRTLPGGATAKIGTENVQENLPEETNQAAIQKWVHDQITANGQVTDAQIADLEKLQDLEKSAHEKTLSEIEQKKTKARQEAEAEIQNINLLETALKAKLGNVNFGTDPKIKAAEQAKIDVETALAAKLAKIDQDAAEQAAQKKLAAEQKAAAEYQKAWTQANKDLDGQLDLQAAESGKKRTDFYAQEYLQRQALAFKFFITGKLTEDQYADAARQAQIKMLDGQAAYNRELQRTQQLQQELTRTQIEAQLHAVQTNPFSTDNQKASQSIPLIQASLAANAKSIADYQHTANTTSDDAARIEALTKINELTLQQIDLQNQLERQMQQTGSFQSRWNLKWNDQLIAFQNQWGDLARSLAQGAFQTITSGIQGMAGAMTNIIMGTQSAGAAFSQFAKSALTSFIQMVLETILYAKLAIPLLTALGVLSGGSTAGAGSAVTIASLGTAMSFVAGIVGFATGGQVDGPGTSTSDSILARLSKGEFVIPASKVNEFGSPFFEAIRTGALRAEDLVPSSRANLPAARFAGGNAGSQNVKASAHVVLVNDRSEMMNALKSAAAEEVIVAAVRKNRLKIGINT